MRGRFVRNMGGVHGIGNHFSLRACQSVFVGYGTGGYDFGDSVEFLSLVLPIQEKKIGVGEHTRQL